MVRRAHPRLRRPAEPGAVAMARKQAIRQALGSATRYDQEAHVQREVAIRLAERIAGLSLPPNPRILEIGFGTGFLTSALQGRGLCGDWTLTDRSPLLVPGCRDASGGASGGPEASR